MPLLELVNICKTYTVGTVCLNVLDNINETAEEGELIALVGPSGAGKSTLLHIIGALDAPTSGDVIFAGKNIYQMKENELNKYRGAHMGFVFQAHYLLDDFTSLENVMLPMLINGKSRAESEEKARILIKEVGLEDRLAHYPKELSGGEQQRIAVARALVNSPKLILADEPTGNLDKINSDAVVNILANLSEKGVCVIIVTHDESIAGQCHRVVRLEKK